jgi:hypothetical protein
LRCADPNCALVASDLERPEQFELQHVSVVTPETTRSKHE